MTAMRPARQQQVPSTSGNTVALGADGNGRKGGILGPAKPFLGAFLTIVFFVVGLALSESRLKGGEIALTLILLCTFVLVGLGSGYLAVRYLLQRDQDELFTKVEGSLARFKVELDAGLQQQAAFMQRVNLTIAGVPSISRGLDPEVEAILSAGVIGTDRAVADFESVAECSEIWVVTKDLHKDVGLDTHDLSFDNLVAANIQERGIRYRYFLPDTSTNRVTVATMLLPRYTEEEQHDSIIISFLGKDQWDDLPYCDGDFAIYFPADPGAHPRDMRVYMEIPLTNRRLWIRTDCDMAREWAGRMILAIDGLTTPAGTIKASPDVPNQSV